MPVKGICHAFSVRAIIVIFRICKRRHIAYLHLQLAILFVVSKYRQML